MNVMVNAQMRSVAPDWRDDTCLNWLRESQGLVGAKLGCGVGLCGACTVWVDGQPMRSCSLSTSACAGKQITTIEGLASLGSQALHPVQQAWLESSVPQCGFCQSGHIMAVAALLRDVPMPTDAQIDDALAGHLCRCGTQVRMRNAVKLAASRMRGGA
jgi:isoquinoline 1-oxidoreductase subunit alpha